MSYVKNKWSDGDVITADKLNNIENGIENEQVDLTGAPGKDGNSVTAIALTTDSSGKVTGGTATLSDKNTLPITVTQSKV